MKFVTDYKELEDGNKEKTLLDYCKRNPIKYKAQVLEYMGNQEFLEAIRASHIYDYVKDIRTTITNKTYTDGEYFWTEEEKYHFERYNLELEKSFIEKITTYAFDEGQELV